MRPRRISIFGLSAALLLCGCQQVSSPMSRETRRVANAKLDPNIIKILTFYATHPFMSFDSAGDPNPEGLKVTFYAKSGRTERGVFADGLIRFKMYKIIRRAGKEPVGEQVKIWEYTPEEASGWRVTKKSVMGWAYQFYLNWGDIDVYNHEIRIVPEFVRRDGRVVRGQPRSLRVPSRKESIRLMDSQATAESN